MKERRIIGQVSNETGLAIDSRQSDFVLFLENERVVGKRAEVKAGIAEYDKERVRKLGISASVFSNLKVEMPQRFPMVSAWLNDRKRVWKEADYIAVGAYLQRYKGVMSNFPVEDVGESLSFLGETRFRSSKSLVSALVVSEATLSGLFVCFSVEVRDKMFRTASFGTRRSRSAFVYPDGFVGKLLTMMVNDRGKGSYRGSGDWARKHMRTIEELLMAEIDKIDRKYGEWLKENAGQDEVKQETALDRVVDADHLEEAELLLDIIRKRVEASRVEYGEEEMDLAIREGSYRGETDDYLLNAEEEMILGWWLEQGLRLATIDGFVCERSREFERVELGVILAKDILFRTNDSLIWSRVEYWWRKGVMFDREEMFQYGCLGLLRACEDYDWRKGKFGTYATYWIDHWIRGESGRAGMAIRLPKRVLSVPREEWTGDTRVLTRVVEFDGLDDRLRNNLLAVADNSSGETIRMIGEEGLWEKVKTCLQSKKVKLEVIQAMRLYFFEGYNEREVARELEVSLVSVKNYLDRGKSEISDVLKIKD